MGLCTGGLNIVVFFFVFFGGGGIGAYYRNCSVCDNLDGICECKTYIPISNKVTSVMHVS